MSTVTTRTDNVVTLRERKPDLQAELQPMQPKGWSEGRNFRQTAAANAPTYGHPARVQALVLAVAFASICTTCALGYWAWKVLS